MDQLVTMQIRQNRFKMFLFGALLTTIIGVLGTLISYFCDWGLTGTGYFLVSAGMINLFAFFFSHRILLHIAKAKQLKQEQAPELFSITQNLCCSADLPMPKLYLMEDDTMNAFATGRNYKHAAIAVTRGLLTKMTSAEVEGVIAHELSHIKNYDMLSMAVISILAGVVCILADLYWSSTIFSKVQSRDPSGISTVIGMILSVFAPISAYFIQLAISRRREFIADASAARLTNAPKALASALRKISMDLRVSKNFRVSTAHLYFSSPSRDTWLDKLFSTHPPIEERITLLEEM